MSDCKHEFDPFPSEPIVVSDEEFYANPLRMDWGPPSIVPCKLCGAPLDRGRYSAMISIPALRRGPEWPPWRDDEDEA
jgi:hypothetical protein